MKIFDKQLQSNPLQFGFKQHTSTSHALFTFKTVTEYYVKGGSTVNLCALVIAKVFDRVDHLHFVNVINGQMVAGNFIELLLDWLLKCYTCVHWGRAFPF